jgi:hypothetical protein
MKFGYVLTLIAVGFFAMASFGGCDNSAPKATTDNGDHGHDHDHGEHGHDHGEHGHDHGDHGHDHGDHGHDGELPAHGPNNGHLFTLEGSDYVGEWMHYNANDIIRVVLLDKALENAISIDGVKITPTAGDDKTPFELELDEEKNKGDQTLVYMLDSKKLQNAMSFGVEVEFTIGDDKFAGKIAPHAPHDH